MDIRTFTKADLPKVLEMSCKFLEESGYAPYADPTVVAKVIVSFLDTPQDRVLYLSEHGMLLGICLQFPYGVVKTATELAWYVETEFRNSGEGILLLNAFESWAKEKDCKLITMISLDDKVSKFYEKNGYVSKERTYIKEI